MELLSLEDTILSTRLYEVTKMAERISTGLANEIVGPGGSSMADALEDGVIRIYSGAQPADADTTEQGTLLVENCYRLLH